MDFDRKVVFLDVNDILPNRFQPRIKFNEDSINELCDSIREHGVIQPIVVRKMGDKYEIIAGERRFKANLLAGKNNIPAIVTELNDKDSAEIALIENVQRKDLTPIEEAISYKKILDMGYLTQDDLANKLGKTQSTVANKLRLLNLSEDVQEALLEGKISERHARSILRLPSASMQKKMLDKVIIERLTVRKTDNEISKILKGEIEAIDKKINENLVPFISNEKVNFMTAPDFNNTSNETVNHVSNESTKKESTLFNENKNTMDDLGYTPYYEKEDSDEEIVPIFSGENSTFIPSFELNNISEKEEEPVVIIEEDKNMINDNQYNNNQNDFNPFDMTNNNINVSEVPSAPIEESVQFENSRESNNNDFININNIDVKEPNVDMNNTNNFQNPGFMDIEKIKNEAVDIDFTNINNNETNENQSFMDNDSQIVKNYEFDNQNSLLRNNVNISEEKTNNQKIPGKFFGEPFDEKKDKNEEVVMNNNPFDVSLKNNEESNFILNIPEQEKMKTIDEVSQFSDINLTKPTENNGSINLNNDDFIKPMMNQDYNNYNPVNDFSFRDFGKQNENVIKPTATEIPPMEDTKPTVSFNQQSFIPKEKDINTAMLAIKECESKLKRLGFNVNTEDFDFENMYQIMFRIEK